MEKRARACVYEKKVVSLHPIYVYTDSNRIGGGGDVAAECGGDLPERSLVPVATYPSE